MDSSEILFCGMFLNSFSFADFFLVLNFFFVNHSFCSATRSWLYSQVGHQGRCQRPGQRLCLQEETLKKKMDGAPENLLMDHIYITNKNNTKLNITLCILVLWVLVWNGNELCLLCFVCILWWWPPPSCSDCTMPDELRCQLLHRKEKVNL